MLLGGELQKRNIELYKKIVYEYHMQFFYLM